MALYLSTQLRCRHKNKKNKIFPERQTHENLKSFARRDVPVGVPLDLSTPTGMSCIGTYGENSKSNNVLTYRVLLVAFLLLWHEN